ncbi:DUF4383 domain-containing protein [Nostoc sp.]|uniref:DUF4383 domain-containing protein n=1 Tax=Nostoc sp. TaxID=1180 RepID=UPI002FFB5539
MFGAITTNFLYNLVRCAVGFFGITCYSSANFFCLVAVIGLLPSGKTFLGLMPLFGYNVLLNTLAAIAAAYYSLVIPAKVKGVNVAENI